MLVRKDQAMFILHKNETKKKRKKNTSSVLKYQKGTLKKIQVFFLDKKKTISSAKPPSPSF
jgi:hypothetical protein